ncbi:MAG: aminotransferase class V-fold PLP-dependent enzyme [Bdellovibrionales bacterium]|nr:aminotransferase class V-fold PLP-dependent enzyme [Bdellovibrionales bacterium]
MERSISNRFYFDYNATSPLSKKVSDYLHSGDFLFGNPASLHTAGKKSKKFINESIDYIYQIFNLKPDSHKLFFHSGASEGINSVFKGLAFKFFKEKKAVSFFFSEVDHACVIQLKDDLEAYGHKVHFFSVDKNGLFDQAKLIKNILDEMSAGRESFVNYTYVNNETGVVWPLVWAEEIKKQTQAFIHVDAVQIVGKISNWEMLSSVIDAYTFSGHKFGALKGIGFTFLKNETELAPLIVGGTQQQGMRAGTENALGVYSIKLALHDMKENFKSDELGSAKNELEASLVEFIGSRGEVVARTAPIRNLNTIFLVLYGQKAEILSAKFDMMGIDLSTGSACSSGIIKENRILMAMGYSFEDSRAALRFSFSPFMDKTTVASYVEKIKSVLK